MKPVQNRSFYENGYDLIIYTGYSARIGAVLFVVDFLLTITIYFVILHQKKKLTVHNQTGEILVFNLRVKNPTLSGSISDVTVCLPGSTIPAEVAPHTEARQQR